MSVGKVVVTGVLAGIAVGTILAVLYAPQKGSKTRKQIMDKGNDFMNRFKQETKDAVKKGKDNLIIKQPSKNDVKLLTP